MTDKTRFDAEVAASVAARTALIERARMVLPTLVVEGKTDRELQEACLHHLVPGLDLRGRSDAYVASAFNELAPQPTMPRLEQWPKPNPSTPKQDACGDDDVHEILLGRRPASMEPQPQRLDAIDYNDVHKILSGGRHNERVFAPEWAKPLDTSTREPAAARTAPPAATQPQRLDAIDPNDVHSILAQRASPTPRMYVAPPWTQPLASSRSKHRADASSSDKYRPAWRSPLASSKRR